MDAAPEPPWMGLRRLAVQVATLYSYIAKKKGNHMVALFYSAIRLLAFRVFHRFEKLIVGLSHC